LYRKQPFQIVSSLKVHPNVHILNLNVCISCLIKLCGRTALIDSVIFATQFGFVILCSDVIAFLLGGLWPLER